VVVSN